MYLTGEFVVISVESREKDRKVYHSVNIEAEDGKLFRIGTSADVVPNLQKYQPHRGMFDVGSYNGQLYMRLVAASCITMQPEPVSDPDPAPESAPDPKSKAVK